MEEKERKAEKEKKSLSEYKKAVNHLADQKSDLIFANSGVGHASAVISTIFNHSVDSVRIYAQNMDGSISNLDNYYDSLRDLIIRGCTLKVMLDEVPKEHSEAFSLVQMASKVFQDKIYLRFASDEFKTSISRKYPIDAGRVHFCVGDESRFRLEVDAQKHKAFCSMNNGEYPKKLNQIFDEHFEACSPIAP